MDVGQKFAIVDVGSCGSNSDAGVFSRFQFGKRLITDRLDLRQDVDSYTGLPFVGDDAFPLRGNLMKPLRLTYIYFLIAFTQGSHDFRFDMGRMGIRAGKLTSPEFFDGSTCAQYV